MDLRNIPAFGVAGNFTGHLEQAGEARDFTKIVAKEGAPKAVFPTNIPGAKGCVPEFLGVYPFDDKKIIFPKGEQKLQIEPECALLFDVEWNKGKVTKLSPVAFGASNDCSIRKEGAKKISVKKNWGPCTKGFAMNSLIEIDSFSSAGNINDYRIASYLVRDGKAYCYGEDSLIRDYSYVYDTLIEWLIDKLNNQEDIGPAEPINSYLNEIGCPARIMISIGATRYTEWGENNFLAEGDEAVVVVYSDKHYSHDDISAIIEEGKSDIPYASILRQIVVME